MRVLLVLLLSMLVVATVRGQGCNPPPTCDPLWNPICAFSPSKQYRTFSSMCTMNLNNQCYKGDFILVYYGVCKTPT